MRKIGIISLICILLPVIGVFAQTHDPELPEPGQGFVTTVTGIEDILDILQTAANWLLAIVLIIATIMIIYAGLKWMTAGGDEEKLSEARRILTWALGGTAAAFLAWGLIRLIRHLLERS